MSIARPILRNFRPIYSANNPIGVSLLVGQGWRIASTLPRSPEKNDNPIGLVFQKHAKMHQHKNKIIQKNGGFIAYSAIKMPNKPPRHNPLLTSAKLSPMIEKFSYKTILICL